MKVRNATEADLPEIVAIYNSTVPSRMVTADLAPVSVASKRPWFRAHDPQHRPLWVVDEGGRIRAWLSFNNFHDRPAYRPTAEISLYVAEADRRQGLGRALLAEAIARAPAHGVRTLVGLIWAHNAPSLRLFEQFGFARWGHLPQVAIMDEIERDLVIVGRRIEAP